MLTMNDIKVREKINIYDLRNICINEGWYTNGNDIEYANMFKMAQKSASNKNILNVAYDIYNHSDFDFTNGNTENSIISYIMYRIKNDAIKTYYETED